MNSPHNTMVQTRSGTSAFPRARLPPMVIWLQKKGEKNDKYRRPQGTDPPSALTSFLARKKGFHPKKPNLQPAVVAVGDLGHLGGDPCHLEVIHLEDPTPRDVDVGGLGDVDDGFGLGAGNVVEVGFVSAVEAGLEKGPKWRIWRD